MASDVDAGDAPTTESITSKLNQLKASATQQYALKNYAAAADSYSEAAELQDELNGEMALDNAELLYHYGRCLYHVGVSQSDVLGGKVAQQEEPKRKKRKISKEDMPAANSVSRQEILSATNNTSARTTIQPIAQVADQPPASTSKPFFQITGDENWTDSEEEADDAEGEEAPEEEDDDLAIAYEILDSARILFDRKIEALHPGGTDQKNISELRQLKERLADTYDLQAEIKLENEQFKDAVNDAEQALALKLQLYPQESGVIAEAHYKLSIALDFAALPSQPTDDQPRATEDEVDEEMRKQAAEEMEKAIMSCQARITSEEASLPNLEGSKLESQKKSIADARDLVKDMKNRLVDLRTPLAGAASASNGLDADPLKGLLGQMLGQNKAEQLKMLTQATATANDLSGLIKQKKKPKSEAAAGSETVESSGKRKAVDQGDGLDDKKIKLDVDE